MRALAVLGCLLAFGGCRPVRDCREGTLFLEIQPGGWEEKAAELELVVSVPGRGSRSARFPRPPGVSHYSIEVEFPDGYPRDQVVTVELTARGDGQLVASGVLDVMLSEACEARTLVLFGPGEAPDLRGAVDLTGTEQDCFNDVDDDGDGVADCADPDCAATAMCVGDTEDVGVEVTPGADCPAAYPSKRVHRSDLIDPLCPDNACACVANPEGCGMRPTTYTSDADCAASANEVSVLLGTNGVGRTCRALQPAEDFSFGIHNGVTFGRGGSCTPASPTVTPKPLTWGATREVCSGVFHAGGCGAGKRCVPRRNTCVVRAEGQSCLGIGEGTWSQRTSFDDAVDARTCACSCTTTKAGSCVGMRLRAYANDPTCTAVDAKRVVDMPAFGEQCLIVKPTHLTVYAPDAIPTCASAVTPGGSKAGVGAHTLCCTD